MATTVEELAKEQAILGTKLQRVEQEQQALSQSQADLRERQTRAEETDKRILDQLMFIHADMNRRFESVERQFDNVERQFDNVERRFAEIKADIDALKNNRRWIITTFIACVIAISASVSLVVKLWE